MLRSFRYLFFPLSLIYCCIVWLRNWLFDKNILKSASFNFPIICVGNIAVGGTGKTPMVEYLIRLLHKDFKTTIDNSPARTVIYSRQQGSLQLQQMESFMIKNNQVYIAIYIAEKEKFAEFYPTVEKMIDSWEIQ